MYAHEVNKSIKTKLYVDVAYVLYEQYLLFSNGFVQSEAKRHFLRRMLVRI